jgi:hypothetical protein
MKIKQTVINITISIVLRIETFKLSIIMTTCVHQKDTMERQQTKETKKNNCNSIDIKYSNQLNLLTTTKQLTDLKLNLKSANEFLFQLYYSPLLLTML